MAPALKRRKVAASEQSARSIAVAVATSQNSIASYGRIAKSAAAGQATVKEKKLAETDGNILKGLSSADDKGNWLKRKPDSELGTPSKNLKTASGKIQQIQQQQQRQENIIPSVRELRCLTPEPLSSPLPPSQNPENLTIAEPETPTRSARARLESFTINSSPASIRRSQFPTPTKTNSSFSSVNSTPYSSKTKKRQREQDLPVEIQDLINLHSAFLTALNLHYAHHGTATPVDVRLISPVVGRAWGKRAIGVDDVRRILAVQQRSVDDAAQAALLSVWDYGKGKTCIEYCEPADDIRSKAGDDGAKPQTPSRQWGRRVHKQPLDSTNLCRAFSAYLRQQWVLAQGEDPDISVEDFVSGLPLTRLHRRPNSRVKKNAILSKGQQRLTELKQGAAAAQKSADVANNATKPSNPSPSSAGSSSSSANKATPAQRSDSLLNRIRAKELLLASQPAGPTQAQLERRSALQRVPDAVAVLSLLASNSGSSASYGRSALAPSSSATPALSFSPSSASLASSTRRPAGRLDSDEALAAALGMTGSGGSSSRRGLAGAFGSQSVEPSSVATTTMTMTMPLPQAVQHLVDSVRSPVARPQAEAVLRLLAAEVAPGWLTLRELGAVSAVTLRGAAPAKGWRERLDALVAAS